MSKPTLEVKGWASGLGLVVGIVLVLIGLLCLIAAVRGLFWPGGDVEPGSRLFANLTNLLIAGGIPVGWALVRKGLCDYRDGSPKD